MNLFLFFGYALFWTLVFLYVVVLHRQQLRLSRELEALARALEKSE